MQVSTHFEIYGIIAQPVKTKLFIAEHVNRPGCILLLTYTSHRSRTLMRSYTACGITFESEMELPGMEPAKANEQPSLQIRFGEVPETLEGATFEGAAYEAAPGRLLLFTPPASFLVQNGREIIVQPEPGVSESDVRVFLLGSAFGAMLHQRSILPLHGSCVQVGDSAVVFSGQSGAGKSTLAAHFKARGYSVWSDDVSPIRVLPGIGAAVFPGFPRMRLWTEALESLGLDAANFEQPRKQVQKFDVPFQRDIQEEFLPIRKLYVLSETRDVERDPQGIEEITGAGRLRVLLRQTYRFSYLEGLNQRTEHFQVAASVLQSVSMYRLWRPWNLNLINESLNALEEHWKGGEVAVERADPDLDLLKAA
jgi:hypothetical protein